MSVPCLLWYPRIDSSRSLISFAAVAERCDNVRTSAATTAKPRPCSPARAASTAAFSASRLVWKAIESMTSMMLVILRLDVVMSFMASMVSRMTALPCSALRSVSAERRAAALE